MNSHGRKVPPPSGLVSLQFSPETKQTMKSQQLHSQKPARRLWGEPSPTLNNSQDCSSGDTRPGKARAGSSFIHYPMLPPSAGLLQVYLAPPRNRVANFHFFCSRALRVCCRRLSSPWPLLVRQLRSLVADSFPCDERATWQYVFLCLCHHKRFIIARISLKSVVSTINDWFHRALTITGNSSLTAGKWE